MSFDGKLSGRKVAMTGATGFIGRAAAQALGASGATITALLRSRSNIGVLGSGAVIPSVVDLTSAEALKSALDGHDTLVHLAYDVRASGDENMRLFNALCAAAQYAGVKRLIHISSIVVYDDWLRKDLMEQSAISTEDGGAYRQAKIAMERALERAEIQSIVLQPTIVHGPGSALWSDMLLDALRSGPVVLPDQPGTCNAVYVDDVAQSILRAAVFESDTRFERFIISGGDPVSWRAYYEGYQALVPGSSLHFEPLADLRARLGAPQPALEQASAPGAAAQISAKMRQVVGRDRFERAVRGVKRLARRGKPHYPNHGALDLLTGQGVCRIEKAKSMLGYDPQFDLRSALSALKEGM